MRIGRLSITWQTRETKEELLRSLREIAVDPSHRQSAVAAMFLLKYVDPSFRDSA